MCVIADSQLLTAKVPLHMYDQMVNRAVKCHDPLRVLLTGRQLWPNLDRLVRLEPRSARLTRDMCNWA